MKKRVITIVPDSIKRLESYEVPVSHYHQENISHYHLKQYCDKCESTHRTWKLNSYTICINCQTIISYKYTIYPVGYCNRCKKRTIILLNEHQACYTCRSYDTILHKPCPQAVECEEESYVH